MKSPIAFIIFKRPHTTEKVFEIIRQVKPPKLFVIADGPRSDRPNEAEKCEATRTIIEQVDWDCEVLKDYSNTNLGCAKRVSSGLDWVFSNVEEAIILEDDCIPHPSFFPFCEELLEKYRYDTRIGSISGQNVQFGRRRTNYSYYFSRYNHCWGWATWRRAWQYFDFQMKLWSEVKEKNLLEDILQSTEAVNYWHNILQSTHEGKIDSWALRWTLACWLQSSLCIISNINLVSNIGFGEEGTHTLSKKSKFANIPADEMSFPLQHPPFLVQNRQADIFTQRTLYSKPLIVSLKKKVKQMINVG
ncbi:glycosyltransferase family 2 protein [Chlorogloeopsis sp. ULAP02]|uniref:glycosyltransferase family 2 protein n=1 Tax=Chlorogloeopsis sp. ULAP02 TaxID=3107926 RepID=UPI0031370DF6